MYNNTYSYSINYIAAMSRDRKSLISISAVDIEHVINYLSAVLKFNGIDAQYMITREGHSQEMELSSEQSAIPRWNCVRGWMMSKQVVARVKLEIVARQCQRRLARIQRIHRTRQERRSQLYVNLLLARFSFFCSPSF